MADSSSLDDLSQAGDALALLGPRQPPGVPEEHESLRYNEQDIVGAQAPDSFTRVGLSVSNGA